MNKLWIRVTALISGMLFFVFFLQFVSIKLDDLQAKNNPSDQNSLTSEYVAPLKREEASRRLFEFMAISLVVGVSGGILIGRYVSKPIDNLMKAAEKVGKGDLSARVEIQGSYETAQLAKSFNAMAEDLQREEITRKNLIADISHELRTPLTVLSGNLRAVLDHVYPLNEIEIVKLYSQTKHLIWLVNDLRELALAESNQLPLNKEASDMRSIIEETLQTLDPSIQEKNLKVTNLIKSDLPVSFDPGRIKQVWFNLLTNAIMHTPQGGEITFSMTDEPDFYKFSISDTGEGLEANHLSEVFNRFYRADESRSRDTGGTGLGLAIVKALIELHNGQVFAESNGIGKGCTFSFTLPQK